MRKLIYLTLILSIVLSLFAFSQIVKGAETRTRPILSPLPLDASKTEIHTIIFVSDKTGTNNIYAMDLRTKSVTDLTNNNFDNMNPQLSPDGKYIVFYSDRGGTNQIYRMELATKNTVQLTHTGYDEYDPSYAPNGKTIVFKSTRTDSHGDIFVMHADGTQQVDLTPNRTATEEWDPRYSNDGKKIYFVVRSGNTNISDELFVMHADGNELQQLTFNHVPDWYPAINPVSGEIVYVSRMPHKQYDELFSMNADGSQRTKLTNLPGNSDDPAWDPTGQKIIFINDMSGKYEMYLINPDGSTLQEISSDSSSKLSPIVK